MTKYPTFELCGPPCPTEGCDGVLTRHIDIKTKDTFRRCSECEGEFDRKPLEIKLGWAFRTIERAVKGQKED